MERRGTEGRRRMEAAVVVRVVPRLMDPAS